MIRPRHFDLDTLREHVAEVFLQHGYRGTSMSMLTDATGVGKQSLYNALGDKEAAYLQALECAGSRFAMLEDAMAAAPTGRDALALFFDQILEGCSEASGGQNTCMLTAGLMEGIEVDAINAKLHEEWQRLGRLLQSSAERGQQDGSVRDDVDSAALRELLALLMAGMRVTTRTQTDPQALRSIVRWVLLLLDRGAPAP